MPTSKPRSLGLASAATLGLALLLAQGCGLGAFAENEDLGPGTSGGTSVGVHGAGDPEDTGGQLVPGATQAVAGGAASANDSANGNASASASASTPAPSAPPAVWVGPAGLWTEAAVAAVPTTPAVEAEIAAQFEDDTSLNDAPMGSRFAAARAHPPTAAALALLQNENFLPPIPSALGWSWRAYPVTLYPQGAPDASDLHQNGLGDCDGIAPLAGLAQQNPAFVRALIDAKGAGHFVVHMYDPWGNAVDVAVDNRFVADASLQGVSTTTNTAMWGTVLEKAVMVYNAVYGVWNGQDNPGGVGGIGSEAMLPMFTGNGSSVGYYPGHLSAEAMRVVVARSVRSGCVLTGGFSHAGQVGVWAVDPGHGYSVVSPGNDANAMLQMRNPWGWLNHAGRSDVDRSTDGTFTVMVGDPLQPTMDVRVISGGASFIGGNAAPFAGRAQ